MARALPSDTIHVIAQTEAGAERLAGMIWRGQLPPLYPDREAAQTALANYPAGSHGYRVISVEPLVAPVACPVILRMARAL